jgi:hypothetical protein
MISQRSARIVGASLVLFVGACRDAPTALTLPENTPPSASISLDSTDEFPPQPRIINPYTIIGFAQQGGQHVVELRVGMEYIGNKASMTTDYSIVGDQVSQHDRIYNEQDAFYTLSWDVWRRFDQVYYVQTARSCGLEINATTQHQAWWFLYLRLIPDWKSPRATTGSRATPYDLGPCEEEEPEPAEGERRQETTTTSAGGGTITVESCWYWDHYLNGVYTHTTLDHCDVWVYPVDPTMGPMEM